MKMKKVLIVEDSEPDQFLAMRIIQSYNESIDILQAYDGQEALELLSGLEEQPDIIFLDINMPVMDGHEFLKEFNKREIQRNNVVILTSSEDERDIKRTQGYDCVKRYLTKRLKAEHLEDLESSDIGT